VSGSGKSSLALGTLYAEAQRPYLESVAPYTRRLFHQVDIPQVDEIEGLRPAVALQQQRGAPTTVDPLSTGGSDSGHQSRGGKEQKRSHRDLNEASTVPPNGCSRNRTGIVPPASLRCRSL